MANWLQKFLDPSGGKTSNRQLVPQRRAPIVTRPGQVAGLPSASIIYGVAAAALFAIAICFFVTGAWFKGLLVLLPAACFLGFSLYFLKAQ